MSRRFMGRFVSTLNLGVRAQLLSALIGMLLLASVSLSVVFYLQARSRALDQMRSDGTLTALARKLAGGQFDEIDG